MTKRFFFGCLKLAIFRMRLIGIDHCVPCARHYNPRFVYFLPTFWISFMYNCEAKNLPFYCFTTKVQKNVVVLKGAFFSKDVVMLNRSWNIKAKCWIWRKITSFRGILGQSWNNFTLWNLTFFQSFDSAVLLHSPLLGDIRLWNTLTAHLIHTFILFQHCISFSIFNTWWRSGHQGPFTWNYTKT